MQQELNQQQTQTGQGPLRPRIVGAEARSSTAALTAVAAAVASAAQKAAADSSTTSTSTNSSSSKAETDAAKAARLAFQDNQVLGFLAVLLEAGLWSTAEPLIAQLTELGVDIGRHPAVRAALLQLVHRAISVVYPSVDPAAQIDILGGGSSSGSSSSTTGAASASSSAVVVIKPSGTTVALARKGELCNIYLIYVLA
jgi:hypothetical protein